MLLTTKTSFKIVDTIRTHYYFKKTCSYMQKKVSEEYTPKT